MDYYIAAIGFAVTAAGWIGVHFRSKGYIDRQLSGYDEQLKAFWVHVNNRSIHEESMDSKLIDAKFANVNQKIDGFNASMSKLSTDVAAARQAVHDLRDDMPKMILTALTTYGRGRGQ